MSYFSDHEGTKLKERHIRRQHSRSWLYKHELDRVSFRHIVIASSCSHPFTLHLKTSYAAQARNMRVISSIISFAILIAGLAQGASIPDASDIVPSIKTLECRSNVTVCVEYVGLPHNLLLMDGSNK